MRNQSIQDDLVEHMELAGKLLLEQINQSVSLTITRELAYTLNKKIEDIRKGMSPGEESTAIDFIRNEVNPLFRHLYKAYPALQVILQPYMDQTLSGTDILYKKRKAYELSLRKVNETISAQLVKEQQHLQQVYPHYFEKYQTDGVEYNLYIGPSLVKDREFDSIYLWNLRLHQLVSACEIARKIHDLQPELKEPLAITQLILVHSNPINIRFRMEEKQFDVDGAYNVRYEIMKKRIDKALIKGTDERITQPGKITIIYSMEKERAEYTRYIEYLQAHDYIKNEPEYLELEKLQGVQGLKAIRLEVNVENRSNNGFEGSSNILEIARKPSE